MKQAEKLFKELINENYIDLQPINKIEATPKTNFEIKYAEYLAEEAKVVEKKTTKEVDEVNEHGFDAKDKSNLDNQIGQEVMNGVYFEAKQNPDKTIEEIKEIVSKNLAKDGQYYINNAMFGIDGLKAETMKNEEVSGKHAASGYSDKLKEVVKESLMGESYSEFQRDDKGAKDVDKKDKGEEDAFGAGVAKGEKIEKKKMKKTKKESIDSRLAEIGKEAEAVKLEAQLDFLQQMQREIKDLERKKMKMEKIYEKSCGKKYQKEEIVDEMEVNGVEVEEVSLENE